MNLRRAAVAAISIGLLQCSTGDVPQVGAPCLPSLEKNPAFRGFKITEETIEIGAPECGAGVCLVNHFQGRVSCPLGQASPKDANGLEGCVPQFSGSGEYVEAKGSCADGDVCAQAGSRSPPCDPTKGADADASCAIFGAGQKCNTGGFCECNTNADCAFVTDAVVSCDPKTKQCMQYACAGPGGCQLADSSLKDNAGKGCCVPGSGAPLIKPVCGQCRGLGHQASNRGAESSVYCSCRCGVAEGAADEPDYPFCSCPSGFECSEIRKNLGLDDQTLSGKYCIKMDTAYDPNEEQCYKVDGYWSAGVDDDLKCGGAPSGECESAEGPCDL